MSEVQIVFSHFCNCQSGTLSLTDFLGIPEFIQLTVQHVVLPCYIGTFCKASWGSAARRKVT